MQPRRAVAVVVALSLPGAASCGYPAFQFDSTGAGGHPGTSASSAQSSTSGGSGGSGGAATSTSQSASATSAASTTGVAASSSSGGPMCPVNHLLISEIRSRGPAGAGDEFIELYNPTSVAVPLDDAWSIKVRGSSSGSYLTRWQGPPAPSPSIPAHGHFLIAGPNYAQSPAADVTLATALTADSASVLLINVGTTIDAVCFAFGDPKLMAVSAFTCEGVPASNSPHDDTTAGMSDLDSSIARLQNGCADSGDNATDFAISHPAQPESTTSPLVP